MTCIKIKHLIYIGANSRSRPFTLSKLYWSELLWFQPTKRPVSSTHSSLRPTWCQFFDHPSPSQILHCFTLVISSFIVNSTSIGMSRPSCGISTNFNRLEICIQDISCIKSYIKWNRVFSWLAKRMDDRLKLAIIGDLDRPVSPNWTEVCQLENLIFNLSLKFVAIYFI